MGRRLPAADRILLLQTMTPNARSVASQRAKPLTPTLHEAWARRPASSRSLVQRVTTAFFANSAFDRNFGSNFPKFFGSHE